MKILLIGPNPQKFKGGMATVLEDIINDNSLNKKYEISMHSSCIKGNIVVKIIYSIIAYFKFLMIYKRYDLFHIHMASYTSTFRKGFYVRFLKKHQKKVILHVHGGEYLKFYEHLTPRKKVSVQNIWNRSDLIIVLSEEWKNKFESTFGLNNIVVVNNGIDIEKYKTARGPLHKTKNSFLMLGRLETEKGVYDLIEAVNRAVTVNPKITVYLAGDGEIENVKKVIKENGLNKNIKLMGWVDLDKKIELLKKVSTVILPSYNEGLPMSLLEGMAAGKAIISTNVGAIPELISDLNGILFSPKDIIALEKALIKCSTNIATLEEMSQNNMDKIEHNFSIKNMHEKLADIYKKLYY
ncbi:MAG: glycosyltransferase family 4 protein [Blautia sp.]